jgi:ribosomal protein S11
MLLFAGRKMSNLAKIRRAEIKFLKHLRKYPHSFRLARLRQITSLDEAFGWWSLKLKVKRRRQQLMSTCGVALLDFSAFDLQSLIALKQLSVVNSGVSLSLSLAQRLDALAVASFFWTAFWFQWFYPVFRPLLYLSLQNHYLVYYGNMPTTRRRRGLGVAKNFRNLFVRSVFLSKARSFTNLKDKSALVLAINKPIRLLRSGTSKRFIRFLSPQTSAYSHFPKFTPVRRRLFWYLRRKRRSRFFFLRRIRLRMRVLKRAFPRRAIREFRFIRKYKALFTVRALHTNLFFTIRQGNTFFQATTGMFDDLKRGTKRKRTLMAGWFLADRVFDKVGDSLKSKSIFRINVNGRTSGRRGIWFSWRTKMWRIYQVYSRTPIAFNGTRACRKRRL